MSIIPHANDEPLHILSQFAKILLVVWSANSDVKAVFMILTDMFVRVIASSIRTNRATCSFCPQTYLYNIWIPALIT